MGFRLASIIQAKQILRRSVSIANQAASTTVDVPKGYFAVYVGANQKKRFVVPITYLNQPLFQDLLSQAEEEFGFDHPMGGLTIPCSEDTFIDLTSRLNGFSNEEMILIKLERLSPTSWIDTDISTETMGIRLPHAKQILCRFVLSANQAASMSLNVPKGYFAVYVGETQKKRFVVPVPYLNPPSFHNLPSMAEEEFWFDHPMGGLTIPCEEDTFINVTCRLNRS